MLEHWGVRLAEEKWLAPGGSGNSARDRAGAGDLEPAALVGGAHWVGGVWVCRDEEALWVGAQAHGGAKYTREIHVLVESMPRM